MAEGSVQRVRIKFNDEGEQKLIPSLNTPKKPPTKAQIRAARIMAEVYSNRKGILSKSKNTVTVQPAVVIPAAAAQQQQRSHSPLTPHSAETDDEQEDEVQHHVSSLPQQQHYGGPPSSPEAPSYYRGKPLELTSRRY